MLQLESWDSGIVVVYWFFRITRDILWSRNNEDYHRFDCASMRNSALNQHVPGFCWVVGGWPQAN